MPWTKRQFVEQAFEEAGFASYVYQLTTDQLRSGLRRLDNMMSMWSASKSIDLGYPITSNPQDSSLDTMTNVPAHANSAVYLNLALLLAPSLGKAVPIELKNAAHTAFRGLLSLAAMPDQMQYPNTLPSGAGNKSYRFYREYMRTPETGPLRLSENGQLIFTES
jgi:hypothetical protein